MDLVLLAVGLPQPVDRKAWLLRGLDQHLLAARQEIDRRRDLLDRIGRDHHRAVPVGMDDVVGRDDHAADGDRAAELDQMDMRVARHDRAGQHEEAGGHRVEIAHRTVGDDADAAEPLVHMRLDFAPEGAEPGIGRVDVLDHRQARQRLGGDVLVIAEPDPVGALPVARMRLARADHRRPREGDDRLHLRKAGDQRPAGKADRAPRRDDNFKRVADRRGIPGAQRLEAVAIGQAGHHVSPAGQGSPRL